MSETLVTQPAVVLNGFRLKRLEVYNWGTFDGRVWSLELNGRNGLLTGDIGSGKSTLVDAVTTLLVPSQRVSYNKAAGADAKERSLRSYVLGYYRSEKSESTGSSKPVALRDAASFSVILGVFSNEGMSQDVTLAVVFWMKEPHGQPARIFVGAEKELSIADDFANFKADIGYLKKRLVDAGHEWWEAFPKYGAWFRRRFGIDNEQALELFHQTVSMKSVGNLTDFVRDHMLESFEVRPRIDALIDHFDDLNRAHEAVLKAKKQISLLIPLVSDCDKYQELAKEAESLKESRDWLRPYFASLKLALLDRRLELLKDERERLTRQIEASESKVRSLRKDQIDLRSQITQNGGDRLEWLEGKIAQLGTERDNRSTKADRYSVHVGALGETVPETEEAFLEQAKNHALILEESRTGEASLQNSITEDKFEQKGKSAERNLLKDEIESLKSRRSNIPSDQVAIREALCQALSLCEDDLPFAGELIRVREDQRDWEGAAERLLRGFAISLLVPDHCYPQVSEWVDRTHLRGRLVYFRLRNDRRSIHEALHPDSLVHKLEIKEDTQHYQWLEHELHLRFDLACCTTHDQFRRERLALTRQGQIKHPGGRHEKDDRSRIDDRSRYVLGWSNLGKIATLESAKQLLEDAILKVMLRIQAAETDMRKFRDRITTLERLDEFKHFHEIDWQSVATEIAGYQVELEETRASSDLLLGLSKKLEDAKEAEEEEERQQKSKRDDLGATRAKEGAAKEMRDDTSDGLADIEVGTLDLKRDQFDQMREEALGEHQLSVESCSKRESEVREWLQKRIDNKNSSLNGVRDKIVRAMTDYKNWYKIETTDVDSSIESADEFRKMLQVLEHDDLPRFERRFKESLNTNTIREIAAFSVQLENERHMIKERIERINASLSEINYNPSRFIRLEAEATPDAEIRDFLSELKACMEGSLTGSDDDQYSEAKFLQVRQIIDRFRGREGVTELDRRWTQKVTDVRNWFTFAASERWREDDKEHEHYSDSGGKSGGQKEKLAYTILAASLAYQFGLEWGKTRSRSFRFVCIDEAFGRGSDESAEYGLQLFERLNLQLLIVTPLQKIHIIEPYVSWVGFVQNADGRNSKLRNLTIETYRKERDGLQ